MKKIIDKKTIIQFIKFGIVGFSNTAISYLIYTLLTYVGVYYVISNVIGFILSVLNSFYWNNRYVFKSKEGESRNWFATLIKTFIAYAGTGLVLSNILLVIFVEVFKWSKYITPLLSLIITIPLNFIINKFWSYKTKKKEEKKNK